MSSQTWVRKYFPNSTKGIVGNNKVVKRTLEFVKNYSKQKKKALLLVGDTGSGKTALAYAVASQLGYELFEVNPSHHRNAEQIREVVGTAANTASLFGKGKVVLVDDVDAFSGRSDRGGIRELIKIIKTSANPIIMTAQSEWEPKIRTLKKYADVQKFRKLMNSQVKVLLRLIAENEGLELEGGVLEKIAEKCRGDMRAAITDLQVLSTNQNIRVEDVESIGYREKSVGLFDVIDKIFKSNDYFEIVSAMRNSDERPDELLLWIVENLPRRAQSKTSLKRAYKRMAEADLMSARIRRHQHWRFLVYVQALMVLGAMQVEQKRGWIRTRKPSKIAKLGKTRSVRSVRENICLALAEECHTSSSQAEKVYLPFLKTLYKANKKRANELFRELGLGAKEKNWLRK